VSKLPSRHRHQKEARNKFETRTNTDAVQRCANGVRRGVCRAGHRTVRLAQPHHEIAVVQRIRNQRSRFVSHQAFRASQVAKERHHFFEIGGATVIDDGYAAQIQVVFTRGRANNLFFTQQRDARQTLIGAMGRGDDRPRIIAFGKYNVLGSGRGALANSFENVHCVICIMCGMSEVKLRSRMKNLLLFIPNLLLLSARLMIDPRVPATERVLVAGAILYALIPFDFIPDMLPFIGQVDDAYLIAISLLRLMTVTDPRVVREHWRGGGDVVELVGSTALIAKKLLPPGIRRVLTAQVEVKHPSLTELAKEPGSGSRRKRPVDNAVDSARQSADY